MLSTLVKVVGWLIYTPLRYGLPLAVKLGCSGAVWAWRHPRTTATGVPVLTTVLVAGWQTLAVVLVAAVLAGITWLRIDDESFDRLVLGFLRTWIRRWAVYQRRWAFVARRCDLAIQEADSRGNMSFVVPKITSVTTTEFWDTLLIKMETGQQVEDFEEAAGRIRTAYRRERIRVTEQKPGRVRLELMAKDPFKHISVPPTSIPACLADVDYSAVRVGLTEHLEPWTLSVVGGHTVVSGAPGAGKASIPWNVLLGLAPAIAAGHVRVHGIDPKMMELRQARDILTSYATTADATTALLQKLVEAMDVRKEQLGEAGERDFVPSAETPLELILIDELAPLLAYWSRSHRQKIEDALGLLLTQGRAPGFIIFGAIQEPTKDILTVRDLFGRRIGMRLLSQAHTDAALADDAVERGALCHRIPESLAGVSYQLLGDKAEATRARAGHVQNEDISELVQYVLAHQEAEVIQLTKNTDDLRGAA